MKRQNRKLDKEQIERKRIRRMKPKLVTFLLIVSLAFAGLAVVLVRIVTDNNTEYQKKILSQQSYDSTTIPFRRGDIVDSKGLKLATSEKVYNLVIDAKVMNTELNGKTPYLEPTLQALAENFDMVKDQFNNQFEITKIRQYVLSNKTAPYYVALRQLTYEQIESFKAAEAANSNIKGVWFEDEYKRVYPNGSMAADVIGFTTSDNAGSFGLELYYDDVLNGTNGREFGYLNEDLNLERTVKAAVDGYTIHSTIDTNIQMIVEKYIKKFMDEHENLARQGDGAENVGCIVMDVNTGEILAMASFPTYDLNDTKNTEPLLGMKMVAKYDRGNGYYDIKKNGTVITPEVIASMTEDELLLNLNNLWKNFCISNTYEPGSVAKPFTVAAGLEKGTIAPGTTFECRGALEVGGFTIKCHNGSEGTMTLENAVAKSCNVSMMKIAQSLGANNFTEYQNIFNFGLKTNIDLAGEAKTNTLVYSADSMGPTDLATNSFGQNFNITMIQGIAGFASLVNGGYYYEPHMVSKITNSNGSTVKTIEPRVIKQTISEETSALIRQYCAAVVQYGTGKTARPAGYMIGGKTGTAETIDQNTHKRSLSEHVVSFISFAPVDNPQIAVYVVVDRPNAERQGDAKFATRIVRGVLTETLPYLGIYMTEELTEKEQKELEELKLEITTQYATKKDSNTVETDPNEGANADGRWLTFPIDSNSGYRVDPATGYKYDAQAGFLIEGDTTAIGIEEPVNANLDNPEQ